MQIKIHFLGRYRSITGVNDLQYEIKDKATIRDVINQLIKQYPDIEKDKKFLMVLKNKQYMPREASLESGDEITLSPPVVSGG